MDSYVKFVKLDDVMEKEGPKVGYTLLDERHGCVKGCRCGISIYTQKEYLKASAHDDQEGFFVLEGKGRAMVGGEELFMEPGVAFMVPAGVEHVMKCEEGYEFCKVLWFHSAV